MNKIELSSYREARVRLIRG